MHFIRYCSAGILALSVSLALGSPYESKDYIRISWESGVIESSSIYSARTDSQGIPIDYAAADAPRLADEKRAAYQHARYEAISRIALAIRDIQVDGNSRMKDFIERDDQIQIRLAEVLNERVTSREYPEGFFSARSTARFKIQNLISALPLEYPNAEFPTGPKSPLETEYTSLIIDVRGQDIVPMIFPSVYDKGGLEIYGRRYVDISKACRRGLVTYCTSDREARAKKIAGAHPYFTAALSSIGKSPVVSRKDARKILAHKKTRENLKQCAVIFIIDNPGKAHLAER